MLSLRQLPVLLALGLATACGGGGGGGGTPPPPANTTPTLTPPSGLSGTGASRTLLLATGDTRNLVFAATDADGDPLQWTAQATNGSATAAGLSFSTPVIGPEFTLDVTTVAAPAAVTLVLLVEDPRGAAAAVDVRIVRTGAPTVTGVEPDSAFAGRPQVVTITGSAFTLGGSVAPTASFDGIAATDLTAVADTSLTCSTPAGLTVGATTVAVAHAFGNSALPGSAFTAFAFPPALAATDTRLDAGAGSAPQLARDGAAVHAVWVEGTTLAHAASANGGATWSAAQTLSGGEAVTEPQVFVAGQDVVVAWIGSGNSVLARTSHDGGAGFDAAVTLDTGTPVQRPRLVGSGARRYAAWMRGSTGLGTARIVATASTDAGDTWRTATVVDALGGANQRAHELACNGASAWLAFVDERDGLTATGIYTARTANSGITWQSAERRSLAGAAADTPRLCADGNTVWLAWLRANALEYVASGDAGVSWPTVAFVLRSDGGAVSEPALCCEGDRLHAIYLLAGTAVAVSRVGGIGATPLHETVSSVTGPAGEPTIAMQGNYVFAAWRSGAVAGGAARILTAVSTGLAVNPQPGDPPLQFTSPTGFGDGSSAQEQPLLRTDGARLLLAWLDHRTTPAGIFTNRTTP
ncbi:MAG: IPT/TIG domain-containing protein [Planctomycetes bacterium]|nr:IPT/TIG domain-containing protein [Planctomycetota bacterium]